MVMSDAPATARPTPPDPSLDRVTDGTSRGRALAMVRALIAYGRTLLDALRLPDPDMSRTLGFGALTLDSIIARVMRGLQIAAALEVRLQQPERQRDAVAAGAPVARARKPREAGRRAPRLCDDDRMPTAEEIAVMLRRRPVGAVLADICRDLGIGFDFPRWWELRDSILETDGDLPKLTIDIVERHAVGDYRQRYPGKIFPLEYLSAGSAKIATGPPGFRTAA
jgi:hypothetical protein